MRYRIEYADGKCCSFANSSRDLIDWLKLLKDETVSEIRQIYKSAVDMIGFIQIGDDGRSINTTSLNLLQIVAEKT